MVLTIRTLLDNLTVFEKESDMASVYKRDSLELHGAIVDTAEELLLRVGLEKFSLRGIARELGYAPSSLYHYFPDREAILEAVIDRGRNRIGKAMAEASGTVEDPETALRMAFMAFIHHSLERPALTLLVYTKGFPGVSNLDRGLVDQNPNFRFIGMLLEKLKEQKGSGPEDIDSAVRCLWTAAQGLAIRLVLDGEIPAREREGLVDNYVHMILYGLMGQHEREEH